LPGLVTRAPALVN